MTQELAHDREILRRLAERHAEIAALPVHRNTIREWTRMNDLKPGKPMVWINEICWNEIGCEELDCQCQDPFLRKIEENMRQRIYQWDHLPVDMVVEPILYCPKAINDTRFGIREDVDLAITDESSSVVSRHFHLQIQEESDIEKIKTPVVTHDEAESKRRFDLLKDILGDLLEVRLAGIHTFWFAPWDELIRWWGVQEAMQDLILRPELVHMAMDRLVNAYLARLDQWDRLNLFEHKPGNYRVGSGGLGYSSELPGTPFDPEHVRAHNCWGNATAQIFSEVSPAMHEEFALQYERRWLERFALTYYGCCEPLFLKMDILKSVPNLRKVSMSPWNNTDKAVAAVGDRYVFSHKPNPAVLATDEWSLAQAESNLRGILDKTRGNCIVEVILKDISTLRYDPRRLWEWAAMAKRVTEEYA